MHYIFLNYISWVQTFSIVWSIMNWILLALWNILRLQTPNNFWLKILFFFFVQCWYSHCCVVAAGFLNIGTGIFLFLLSVLFMVGSCFFIKCNNLCLLFLHDNIHSFKYVILEEAGVHVMWKTELWQASSEVFLSCPVFSMHSHFPRTFLLLFCLAFQRW